MADPISIGLAVGSAFMGWTSGQAQDRAAAKLAEKQHEFDTEVWKFNWQEATDAHTHALEAITVAEYNTESQRKFKNETAINTWVDKEKSRIFDYNNQVKAYNASLDSYKTQLKYNNVAAELATYSAKRAYQDKLTLLGFQAEDLELGKKETEAQIDLERKGITTARDATKAGAKLNQESLARAFSAKKRELRSKLDDIELQSMVESGQITNMGQTGRSVESHRRSNLAKALRAEEAIADTLIDEYSDYNLDLKKLAETLKTKGKEFDLREEGAADAIYNMKKRVDYGKQQLNQTLKSANLQYDADEEKQKLEKYAQDVKARESIAAQPIKAPQLSKPLTIAKPKFQKPRAPRKGPKPIKAAGYSGGHGLAGLSQGLGTLASLNWTE